MCTHAWLRSKMMLAAALVSLGCDAETPRAESQSKAEDGVGLESGRVGLIRIGSSLDSLLGRAKLVGEELRTTLRGGDLDRYLRIAIGDDTLEIVPDDGRVRRILVRSQRWRTSEGLGVGTSALELSRYPLDEADYWADGLFVRLRTHCGIHFILAEAEVVLAHEDDQVTRQQLGQLGDSVRVSIVVVGPAC